MDEALSDISHSINKSGGGVTQHKPKSLPPPPSALKAPPTTPHHNLPPSPSPAELKKTKKKEEERIQKEVHDQEQTEIRRKVTDYLSNPKFTDTFKGIKISTNATDLDYTATYEKILGAMKSKYKEAMVRMMFERGADVTEAFMVSFLQKSEYLGIGTSMKTNIDAFEPELTELAIEMPNNWVPGPFIRLALKFSDFTAQYHTMKTVEKK